jgi:hypothetical protein
VKDLSALREGHLEGLSKGVLVEDSSGKWMLRVLPLKGVCAFLAPSSDISETQIKPGTCAGLDQNKLNYFSIGKHPNPKTIPEIRARGTV